MAGANDTLSDFSDLTADYALSAAQLIGAAEQAISIIHQLARIVERVPDVEPELSTAVAGMRDAADAMRRAGEYLIARHAAETETLLERLRDTTQTDQGGTSA